MKNQTMDSLATFSKCQKFNAHLVWHPLRCANFPGNTPCKKRNTESCSQYLSYVWLSLTLPHLLLSFPIPCQYWQHAAKRDSLPITHTVSTLLAKSYTQKRKGH